MRIIFLFIVFSLSITSGCNEPKQHLPPTAEEIVAVTEAALNGNTAAVTAALEKGMPVDQTDEYGNSLLMLAAYNGHEAAVQALLDADADISLRNSEGRTALMFASTGPFPSTVRLLLEAGADVDAVDHAEHFTPLMFAASEGLSSIAELLLEAGADPSMKDIDGDTAASFARQRDFTELAGKLQKLMDQKEAN